MDSAQIESLSRTTVDVAYHCGQLAKNLLALECCRMKAVSRRTRWVYMCTCICPLPLSLFPSLYMPSPSLSLFLLVYALSLSLSLCICLLSFSSSLCVSVLHVVYLWLQEESDYTSNGVFFRLNDLMKTIDVIEKRWLYCARLIFLSLSLSLCLSLLLFSSSLHFYIVFHGLYTSY